MSSSTKNSDDDALDMAKLLHALENENNSSIADMNYRDIAKAKNDILQQLQLRKEALKTLHKQLKAYRYVETLEALKYGAYVRWLGLKDPDNIYLRNGGLVCDIKVKNEEIHVYVKNNQSRIFQFNMSEAWVFQKLSPQEQVILEAVELLYSQ